MGLMSEFEGPTHEGHSLDRVYSSLNGLYKECQAVKSTIRTKHSAILAVPTAVEHDAATQRTDGRRKASFRLRTPNQVAGCLKHLAEVNWDFVMECPTPAEAFEKFYTFINAVFDLHFPIRHIVVKDKDPSYMTPVIKIPASKA